MGRIAARSEWIKAEKKSLVRDTTLPESFDRKCRQPFLLLSQRIHGFDSHCPSCGNKTRGDRYKD